MKAQKKQTNAQKNAQFVNAINQLSREQMVQGVVLQKLYNAVKEGSRLELDFKDFVKEVIEELTKLQNEKENEAK